MARRTCGWIEASELAAADLRYRIDCDGRELLRDGDGERAVVLERFWSVGE